jgi:hypothetical protein
MQQVEEFPHTSTNYLTCGDFQDEAAAVADFDARIAQCDLFMSCKEVCGFYLHPRYGAELCNPRIDRILVPNAKLLKAGWEYGPIGIECKKSGEKIGKAVSQAMDYSRAAFELPGNFALVVLRWIFIWPLSTFAGDIESVMAQNRIGGVSGYYSHDLKFKASGSNMLYVGQDGRFEIGNVKCGNRTGNRG